MATTLNKWSLSTLQTTLFVAQRNPYITLVCSSFRKTVVSKYQTCGWDKIPKLT